MTVTLTELLKNYLETGAVDRKAVSEAIAADSDSIIAKSVAAGLTLQQYVEQDPDRALKEAEGAVAEWSSIASAAAIDGALTLANGGSQFVNKNMAALIQKRLDLAESQLQKVNELVYSAARDSEQKKEHLIRTAYNRAVYKGDTRMLIYLIDRIEGRPGESKQVDLDYDNAYNVYQIIHTLFDKQLEVLNSGPGTKMLCCSRRSGKSRLCCAILLIEALRATNTRLLYIGETMEQSEIIVDGEMQQLVDQCKLRDKNGKRLNWKSLDNGSKILIRGLSNTKDPDQIRGHKAKVIVVDEFYHMTDGLLKYLVQEVLKPMQMDYATEYKFICAGTPPPIKNTFGQKCWEEWEVPHFEWTWHDNPHPVDVEARKKYIDDVLEEMGLTWDTPFARREYGGEWVFDDDLLLYPEYHTYNPRVAIPSFNIDQVLFGIDYGVGDNDAIIGIAWDNEQRRGYEFYAEKFNRADIKDRTISQLQYLESCVKYGWALAMEFFPHLGKREANKRILWDADDSDQHVTDHLNMNVRLDGEPELRLNIQNAHKTGKVMMFDKIRDLLRTASLLLIEGGKTAEECDKTVLKRGPNGQVFPEVADKIYHPDLLPAKRYALWNVIGEESV